MIIYCLDTCSLMMIKQMKTTKKKKFNTTHTRAQASPTDPPVEAAVLADPLAESVLVSQ
jgi:hypothetical protein